MTATSQHGFHPDAESLSAFSERALSERERGDVLAHLAICGRCREVVALASEAAAAGEASATARPRRTFAPNSWWKQWRLVWVPTAVVAAFAAVSISVYVEHVDRHGPNVKIAEQNPPDAPTPTSSATEQATVEPPAATAPKPAPTHTLKRGRPDAKEPLPAPAPPVVEMPKPSQSEAQEPQAPTPRTADQSEAYREVAPRSRVEVMQAVPEVTAGAMRPGASQPAAGTWEAKKNQAEQQHQADEQHQTEQQRQAETDKSRMRNFKASVEPFGVHGANAAPPPNATETVTVTASPQVETQPSAVPEPAPMVGFKHAWDAATPGKPIRLPTGLVSVSIASGKNFLLAIDQAGALFLSEDGGVNWESITRQWTGRAIEVRRQARDDGAPQAVPAVQSPAVGGLSPGAGATPPPVASFELSNDEDQTWVSTDGRTWTPK